jgi:uncharacterized protein
MKYIKKIIGMIHLPATISYDDWLGLDEFIAKAKYDLKALEDGGASAALIENDSDSPCQLKGTADVVAPMAIVAHELVKIAKIPLGIEVLLNDPCASLSIAKTCGLEFIRTDYFVDAMTRKGYGKMEINPKNIIDYKNKIKANNIKIYADIQVKYATMLDKNKTIASSVIEAINNGADGIIITGTTTGVEPCIQDIKEAKETADNKVPIIIGSGFLNKNVKKMFQYADWAIVGSSIKTNGIVDIKKISNLTKKIKSLK